MKKYIGTKMLEAERAFRIDGRIYSNENDEINSVLFAEGQVAEMGYRVRYADGYESFSPKGVFEKAYLPLEENKNLKTDAPSISAQMVEDFIDEVFVSTAGEKTTVVRAVLVNGFEILESSSCVSKENYDQKLGFEICMGQIRDRVWYLLGFLLQTAVNGVKRKSKKWTIAEEVLEKCEEKARDLEQEYAEQVQQEQAEENNKQ